MGKTWEFKDIPVGIDPNMPRDRIMFVNENGIYEMTGLGLRPVGSEPTPAPTPIPPIDIKSAAGIPTEAEMEAELSKASEAALAKFADLKLAGIPRPNTDSLSELNAISQQLAQKATDNLISGGETLWSPFMYGGSLGSNLKSSGFISRQDPQSEASWVSGRQDAQNSPGNILGWVPTQMPAPAPKRAAAAEPAPLSKNGGRFVMLEDPE